MWNFMDLVDGHQLQLTNNADKSRTFVSIYMHMNKLYIMEGTVPAGIRNRDCFSSPWGGSTNRATASGISRSTFTAPRSRR